jgi:thiamine biosynthesis lipoprotein
MRSPTEAADEPAPIVRRARPLLGTYVSISLQGPEAAETRRAIEAGFAAVADIHRLMSFHEPGSDVSRLNRDACDRPVEVDRRTFAVLARSTELSAESGGAFDVTVAPLLVASGFLPAPDHTSAPDPDATWRDIEFLAPDRVRYRRPLWIDLGGIAKGYAVDSAMEAIAAGPDAQCAVNAGGDLRISGPAAERVLLRAGQAPDGAVPVVEIENGSLASSSGRGFIPAKGPHIDPRQGRSIGTRSFVSVVAESCMIADGLTKIVLVRRANSGAILRKYGATAYWRNGRGAWRTLGR